MRARGCRERGLPDSVGIGYGLTLNTECPHGGPPAVSDFREIAAFDGPVVDTAGFDGGAVDTAAHVREVEAAAAVGKAGYTWEGEAEEKISFVRRQSQGVPRHMHKSELITGKSES